MRKSIFLSLVTILIMGGTTLASNNILRVATASNLNTGGTTAVNCIHSQTEYESGAAIHTVKCTDCGESLYQEAHVDENNDMCCDACLGTISDLAPSEGEGIVENEITINESIKISIKANESEISRIVVSSWFSEDEDKIYDVEAIYNDATGYYETEINFNEVNGENGTYCFDAVLENAAGNFRYIRMMDVAYTKNGISNVTTNVTEDGTIEVTIDAIEGGEIFIGVNGEDITDSSNWQAYEAGTTYTLEDPNEEVKALNVYYNNEDAGVMTTSATTFSLQRSAVNPAALITKWKIPADNTEIILPATGSTFDVEIDWGDGTAVQTDASYLPHHTYSKAGEYLITVTGKCNYWGYPRNVEVATDDEYYTSTKYITELVSWGELGIERYRFSRCENLVSVASNYTENTFVNTVTIEEMFYACKKLERVDLSNANMPNITNMPRMFYECTNIKSINLNNIDVSKVKFMTDAFKNCENVEEINFKIKATTSATINASGMFYNCKKLTSLDLSTMNTSNMNIMFGMFENCEKLVSVNVSSFDVSKATDIKNMFYGCTSLINLDLSNFVPSSATDLTNMFYGCTNLKTLNLNNFKTSSAQNMANMFTNCSSLINLDISKFDTNSVINMDNMFAGCKSLLSLDVTNFNTSKVTSMKAMFSSCSALTTLDLSSFSSESIENTSSMLAGLSNLKSVLFSNKFIVPTNCTTMFARVPNLTSIILVDSTPTSGQFANTGTQLYSMMIYVPDENAEKAYERAWPEFGSDMIAPILELIGNEEEKSVLRKNYEDKLYTVAGFDTNNLDGYTPYGYNVIIDGDVNTDIPGVYELVYTLVRYINGSPLEIMSKTRKVTVESVIVNPPTKFSASEGLDETVVVLSWKNAEDGSLKYEIWYREDGGEWIILDNDATSEYNHVECNESTKYEYRIRSYNEEGYYSDYEYATGSTIIEKIKGEAILDTIKPVFIHKENTPDTLYSKADAKIEVTFEGIDLNYYVNNTTLTKDDIKVKIGDTVYTVTDSTLTKTTTASGEEFKYTINKIPYHTDAGNLSIVISADKVKDKALNGNVETTLSTGVMIVNSSITTNAPTLSLDPETNEITVTCNQTTSFLPNEVTIEYEYRKTGETQYQKADTNIIYNLVENINYDVRTVLTDVTGNRVASNVATIKTVYLPVKVTFAATEPESGTHVVGTNIKIVAQFNVNTIITTVPTLTIKFGIGNDITLNGTFNSSAKNITYNYTLKANDFGRLTGVKFNGSLVYAENITKEYNEVPEIGGNDIVARTGALNNNTGVYYPYIQDAINSVTNTTETTITLLQDEDLMETILIDANKNILLDLNGKDIRINTNDATAILNNGTLKIKENMGTGEVIAEGVALARAIENNGTLNILGGIYRAKLASAPTGAAGIYNNGNLTIGQNDNNIDILVPLIDSTEYGVQTIGFGRTSFYDGVLEGARNKSYVGNLNIPAGYDLIVERIANDREKTYISTDKMPPEVNYTILTPGWQKEYVEIEITAYDADSGVRSVTLNNEELVLTNSKTTVRLTENREYIIYVEDNASNSASKSLKIETIDIISPKILGATASETEEDGFAELIVEAQDLESGLAGIILKEKDEIPALDEDWYELNEYPTSKQFISMKIEKNKLYYCFAKDRVGNITRYDKKIQIAFIDKVIPVIQSLSIEKDEGKEYVSGKTVIVNINATDNVGVSEVLISDVDLTTDEAKLSNNWKAYNNKIIHKLPVEGDKLYTIYVWVKDMMGNISTRQTASVNLKAFVVGDNEKDYTGTDTVYNKTSLRFLVKDYHFDFENSVTEDNIMLRITSGDKVLRNITEGFTIKKISDYNGVIEKDFEYVGEIYELEAVNLPNTGKLSIVLLEGTYEDLARNKVNSEVRLTDIFVDNNRPIVTERKTGTYENGYENIEFTVRDNEGYLINAIEVDTGDGILKTHVLTNGKVTLPLVKGNIIWAYDKAGNRVRHGVDMPPPEPIEIEPLPGPDGIPEFSGDMLILEYGGSSATLKYTYNGDGIIYPIASDSSIVNVSIDTTNKKVTVSPVNAGNATVTLRAITADDYMESTRNIPVLVRPRPVELEWTSIDMEEVNGVFNYNGRMHEVRATVTNAILSDVVNINRYAENKKINAGKYTAEAKGVDNYNYTVEGGTNITFDWEIKKLDREITLDRTEVIVETGTKEIVKFAYTGEDATAEITSANTNILDGRVVDYVNSGEIEVLPTGYSGETLLTVKIPESINYNEAEKTFSGEVIHKVWLTFDVQGGDPIEGLHVIYGKPYGYTMPDGLLPLATKTEDKFAGWFFRPEGKGGQVTEETIVLEKDRHSIYACWNQPPEFKEYKVSEKGINDLTFSISAYDPDEDKVRYRIYLGGTLIKDTGYITHNQVFTYKHTGLKEYTDYQWYVIADDTYEETRGQTITTRTKCSGTGKICYSTKSCKGYIDKQRECTGGCNANGNNTYWCYDGSVTDCTHCSGGSITYRCSGGSTGSCRACGGTGGCSDSPTRDDAYTETCSCGGTISGHNWSCKSCGVTGYGESCNKCSYSHVTTNHVSGCSSCGSTGSVDYPCEHGKMSSHTATDTCWYCYGDLKIETYCSHRKTEHHTYETKCKTCGGDRIEDYQYTPCEHNQYKAHRYCTTHTDWIGTTSERRHSYCTHNKAVVHE